MDKQYCQQACELYTNCQYFVYDSKHSNCELRTSGDRKCDYIRGVPEPDFQSCVESGYIEWPSLN